MNTIYREYSNLRQLNKNIRNTKKRLVKFIMKKTRPFMWETGYVRSEDSKSLKAIVFFKKNKPQYLKPCLKFTLNKNEGIMGFTEDNAIILDAYGGGLATSNLHDLPVEDLINLYSWVERHDFTKYTH